MKLSIYSIVLVNFLGSAAAMAAKSGQVNEKQEQRQQQQQQQSQPDQHQQQIQPLIPQVVRSVNPLSLATDKLKQQQATTSSIGGGLGALLAPALPMDSRRLPWPRAGDEQQTGAEATTTTASANDNNKHRQTATLVSMLPPATTTTPTTVEIQIDKRNQQRQLQEEQMPSAIRQEDVMSLLLQELQSLDIEALNGAALRGGEPNGAANERQRNQHLQVFQQGAATGADLASAVMASAAGGRLRGRSALLLGGNSNHQVAPSFQLLPASLGLTERGVGGGGYPKRATNNNNRHVPCFFNAITCF